MAVPLLRSRTDKVFGGVCAGLAVYLNLDVALVRVLTVVLALVTGFAVVIVYIVMLFVVPEGEPTSKDAAWTPV